jgi:hypothetical protein
VNARVASTERRIEVTLSVRNLRALLSKVEEMGDSACTLFCTTEEGWRLVVRAEADEQHYAGREPGPMHPVTEAHLRRNDE